MPSATVLIVDDDPGVLDVVQKMLETLDCDYAVATGAESALALIGSQDFDVILSDISMPGLDGLGLLDELRRIQPEIPVVLMSALQPRAEDLRRADAFLPKPFRRRDLQLALDRAIARARG